MELERLIELLQQSGMEMAEDHPFKSRDNQNTLYFTISGLNLDDPTIFVCKIYDCSADPSSHFWRLQLWNFIKAKLKGDGVKILPERVILQEAINYLAGDEIAGILSSHVKGIRKLQRSLRKDLVDEL